MVGDKEMQLIALLVKTNGYMTAQQLANQLNVSTRTVLRTVKHINASVEAGATLVLSERGKGYKLDYDTYLKDSGQFSNISAYSPTERRNEVLLTLLFRSPSAISLNKLFAHFYVSGTVINNDLAAIKKQIEGTSIRLINRNQEVRVVGLERRIRQLIIGVINKLELTDYSMIRKEFPELTDQDLRFISDQIDYIETELNSTVPFPYNINLFSHIYILIKRYRQGSKADFQLDNLIGEHEQERIEHHRHLYEIAENVVGSISRYLHQAVPSIEKYYIFQYLISSRLISEPDRDTTYSPDVGIVVEEMIDGMKQRLQLPIKNDEIETDLALHVQPMLNRLTHDIEINNPLLNDIQQEYPKIYTATQEVVTKVIGNHYHQQVSADEVGFISLYFAKYMEQHERPVRVLIMCSSGVGTSELLRVKVQRQFPELQIVDVVSLRIFEKHHAEFDEKIDLIITTIRVEENITRHPVLLVNAMFNHADQERVQKTVEELIANGR